MTPLIDPENPQGWSPSNEVAVYSRYLCLRIAKKYKKKLVEIREDRDVTGHLIYICIYRDEKEATNNE